jgi:hypothetical protein
MDWATWVEAMEKERMRKDDRFRARSVEMNLSANIMTGIPNEYIFFARQAEEVAKASDLTGEAPEV